MLITPISNNSTSHIKYSQTSFLGAKTATIKKAQLVTDTFVKTKEPSLKKLKDEFFSLIEKTNVMNTRKRGWKKFFVFEDPPKDQKKLLLANNLFLREFVNNDYLLNNESLRENFFTILVKTLGSKHMAECRLSVLNKITSNEELRENKSIKDKLFEIYALADNKKSADNLNKFLDLYLKHKFYESEEISNGLSYILAKVNSKSIKPMTDFIEKFMGNEDLKKYKDVLFYPLASIDGEESAEEKVKLLNILLEDHQNFYLEDAILTLSLINDKKSSDTFLKNKEILESRIDEYSEDYKKSLAFTLALYGINPIEEKQFENLEDEDTLKTVEQIKKNIIKNPDIYLEGIFEDPELKNCYAERATKAMHIPLCMLSKVFDKKTIDYLLRQRESNFHDFVKKFVKIPTSDIEKFKQVLDKKHSEDPKKNIKEFDLFKFSKDLYVDYNSTYRDQDLVKKTLERINSEKSFLSPIENFSFKAEKYVEYFPNLVEGYDSTTENFKNIISKTFILEKEGVLGTAWQIFPDKIKAIYDTFETTKIDLIKWWDLNIPSKKVKLINNNNSKLDIISQKIEEDINQLRKGPAGKFFDNAFSEHLYGLNDKTFMLPPSTKNNNNELIKFTHSVLSYMNKVWNRAKENSKSENPEISRRAQQTLTIYDHLNQRLESLNNFDTSSVTKDIEVEIKGWDRVPHKDFFQGNFSTCCIGMNNVNQNAIVDYLMSPSYNMIELVDTSNGKTIGNALIYFAADADQNANLVIDNIEINDSYVFSKEQSLKLRDSIKDFANDIKKLCLKNKNAKTYLGAFYNDVTSEGLEAKDRIMIPLVYSATDIAYLDAFGGWINTYDEITQELKIKPAKVYELK